MTRRTLTDAERIASIREVIEAARGDWHEATALLSVGADLHWLLKRAALPNREDAAEPPPGHPAWMDRTAAFWLADAMYECCIEPPQTDHAEHVIAALRRNGWSVVREDAPSREGLDR